MRFTDSLWLWATSPPGRTPIQAGAKRSWSSTTRTRLLSLLLLRPWFLPARWASGHREYLALSGSDPDAGHGGGHGELRGRERTVDRLGRCGRRCQAGRENRRGPGKTDSRRRTSLPRAFLYPASAADPISRHGWNRDPSAGRGTRGPLRKTTRRIGQDRGSKTLHDLERGSAGCRRYSHPRSRIGDLFRGPGECLYAGHGRDAFSFRPARLARSYATALLPSPAHGRARGWCAMDLEHRRGSVSRRHPDCGPLSRQRTLECCRKSSLWGHFATRCSVERTPQARTRYREIPSSTPGDPPPGPSLR